MNKFSRISLICLFCYSFISVSISWAWNDEVTHKDLTELAAYQSVLDASQDDFLKIIGFTHSIDEELIWTGHVCDDKAATTICKIKDWLKYGAEKEDKTIGPITRTVNHFHDPYSNTGLSDVPFPMSDGISALVWAQDRASQIGALEGDQSWPTLRNCYRSALTAQSEAERQALFAQLFKGIGHQMHLVQDMAVPYHVRRTGFKTLPRKVEAQVIGLWQGFETSSIDARNENAMIVIGARGIVCFQI